MKKPAVADVLGTTKEISHKFAEDFYLRLQRYVDSTEKSSKDSGEKKPKEKVSSQVMEYWPLIKVVKIYTKSDALSTGASRSFSNIVSFSANFFT